AARVRVGDGPTMEPKLAAVDRPLLERAWAQAKIAALSARPGKDEGAAKTEIVRLSTTYRVLSPYTALLVLETEADYARYKIDRKALADILTVDGSRLLRSKRGEELVLGGGGSSDGPPPSDGVVLRAPPAPQVPPPPPPSSDEGRARALSEASSFGM